MRRCTKILCLGILMILMLWVDVPIAKLFVEYVKRIFPNPHSNYMHVEVSTFLRMS